MKKLNIGLVVLVSAVLSVCTAPAVAAEVAEPAFDVVALVTLAFGDSAPVIIGWVSFVLVLWSQLRQLIPPKWLEWLPNWVVWVLEFLASNLGQAANKVTPVTKKTITVNHPYDPG